MPKQPDFEDIFRLCADGSIDMTSHGLDIALSHWGFGFRNKRVRQFNNMMAQLVCTTAKEIEAKTGTNPFLEGIKRFFLGVRSLYLTDDGDRCCDDCRLPLPSGPMLHDEVWATIAEPHTFLCLDCIEKRLGRQLTQGDLTMCPFNAGWVSFDGADVAAMQFARGRRLLPESPTTEAH